LSLNKAARLAAAALDNSVRLHRDSVLLFRNDRYASSFQLSVLSQEEIGKSFLLEEFIYRIGVGEDPAVGSMRDLLSHSTKQFWFVRHEVDIRMLGYRAPRLSRVQRLIDDALSGRLERRRQDASYVGLTRDARGKADFNGQVLRPERRVTRRQAAEQITRVSDVLTWLVEGYQRELLGTEAAEIDQTLSPTLEAELADLWPTSPGLRRTLNGWRSRPLRG
jgi:AbiV family abortive infection protein